ncbi:MAG: ABC transporter ATP-binding protein [Pseudomonadales bacterium]|jgi:putative ABC transport system ATP-binding protein
MSWILSVEGLHKRYLDGASERRVLDDVSFQLSAGEVLAVCGPSGSGKSTLLNLIAGLMPADAGVIKLQTAGREVDIAALDPAARTLIRRRHLGYVFQFFNLVPTLTVRENVLLPLELAARADLRGEALERLEVLGLGDHLDDFPDSLSGGERQRTAIARALAHRPALVLADEPTGNLDVANGDLVAELLWRETRAQGCALVVASHNESMLAAADQVVRLGGSLR